MNLALFSEILINAGPLAALAALALWMLNRVWKDRHADACRHSEELQALQTQTLEALRGNTEALVRLTERLGRD